MDVELTFLFVIEVIGTIAFAISGIRMAAAKHFDWFGAYTVGLVTAIGGGTLRDILLDIPVFWMQTWWYLAVTGISLGLVILFRKVLVKTQILFVFDTIGAWLFDGHRHPEDTRCRLSHVGGDCYGCRDRCGRGCDTRYSCQ